jgi:MFS family permease
MLANTLLQFRQLSRNARLYLISNTIQAVSAGALAVIYTLYVTSLGYGTDFIGLALVIGTVGGGLGIIPANLLVARWGWRITLICSDVIGAVALGVQVFVPTPPVILVTTLGIGASVSLLLVVNAPFLAGNSHAEERTALFALSSAMGFLAAVVGALLGGFLPGLFASPAVRHSAVIARLTPLLVPGVQSQSFELAILATGALALPSIFPVLLLTDVRPAPQTERREPPRRRAWLRRDQWRAAMSATHGVATGPIGRFSATQSILGFGAGLFGPYVAIYFVKALGASVAAFGELTSALTILQAVGTLMVVPIVARVGKIRAAVTVQLISLPFLMLLGLAPALLIGAVAFLIRGPIMNAAGPPLQAYLMESTADDSRVLASGVYNVSWLLASALGAGAGGLMIPRLGFHSVFLTAAGLYAISALLVAFWFGRRSAPPPWPHVEAASVQTSTHA